MGIGNIMISILAALPLALFSSVADAPSSPNMPTNAPTAIDCVADEPIKVSINAGGKIFTYTDEPITPSDFTVAEEIEKRRINAPFERKIELVDAAIQKGASYKTALLICFPRLKFTADAVAKQLYIPAEDARVVCENGGCRIIGEKSGRKLDEDKLYGGLYYSLKFFGGERTVKTYTVNIEPNVRAAELRERVTLRSSYTTDFSTSSNARAHNVVTAVKKFDGAVIENGCALSFNSVVGERTQENGFKTAKIIVDGKYVDGVGGGACQASTAVYNAALTAGLAASANSHSICPSYCPPGLDAMISSASDMVLRNGTGDSVYFSVKAGGGKATVNVYGAPCEFDIVTESAVVATIPYVESEITDVERKYFDESAVKGDRLLVSGGKDGYKSETYLKYYRGGKFCKRVKIRSNTYKPLPQIIAVAP